MTRTSSPSLIQPLLGVVLLGSIEATSFGSMAITFEPYLGATGWGHLKLSQDESNPSPSSSSSAKLLSSVDFTESLGLGLRIGAFLEETYFATLDFVEQPKVTTHSLSAPSWSNTQLGFTAGAQLPSAAMKFWIGFNFLNSITPNRYLVLTGITDSVGLQGTAFKIGSSIRVYDPVWLNFEMIYGQFLRYSNPASTSLPNTISISYNYFFLSLGVPISGFRI